MTLGKYPTLSLADAREQAKAALREVALERNPALAKRERRNADSFGELADRYIEEHAKPNKKTWKEDQRKLRKEVLPAWRNRSAREITRRDVRDLIEAVARRGAPIQANRLRALLHTLFNFAVQREIVDSNPATGTPKPGGSEKDRQRQRVLSDDEIRQFWETTEEIDLPMGAFFRLRLITAQRGGEVAQMRWQDIDLDNSVWTIPAEHSKNGLSHRVHLSDPALELLAQLPRQGEYVLAGARGNRQQSEAAQSIPIEDFRGHDLRRTAATSMASAGVPRLHISKVLNHADRGVTAIYDRHSYDPEKQIALDTWARTLSGIVEGKGKAEVVPFAR